MKGVNPDRRSDVRGKWEISPDNFAKEVLSDFDYSGEVIISDSTIKKIEHTPGTRVPFPVEEKVEIAAMLEDIGIQILGLNPTHYYGTERNRSTTDAVRAIAKRGFKFKLWGSNFGTWRLPEKVKEERVDWLADMGITLMTVTLPGSDAALRRYGASTTLQQLADDAVSVVEYGKKRGMETGPLFADSGRGSVDELLPVLNFFLDHGADVIGLVDTFGALSPQGTRNYLKKLNRGLKRRVPILYHAHDGFGMATALATTAALEGCVPDVAVNGLGDTAFADLAQVAVSLELLYGARTGIKLERLTELSRLVEHITGIPMQPHRPVTGVANYVPLGPKGYIDVLNGRPYAQAAFEPELVGQRATLVWWEGMATPETVKAKLAHLGLSETDQDVSRALQAIERRLLQLRDWPAWVDDVEISEICRTTLASSVRSP